MIRAGSLRYRRLAAIAVLSALFVTEAPAPAPASAQNLLEALFGGFRRAMTPQRPRYSADPNGESRTADGAPSSGYCVRLCDGRYFPVSGRGNMNAGEMCRAFCPAAPTQIFSGGGGIANAVAPNGQRYSNLPNAFVYREKMVADCSCDGKSPLGLVRFDAPVFQRVIRPSRSKAMMAQSAALPRICSWSACGALSRRPMKRVRTPCFARSGSSRSIVSPKISISDSTSSAGRVQFSVENA